MDIAGKRIILVSPAHRYSEAFKRHVVREYERGGLNKDQLKRKYNIDGKSSVLEWCRKYGKLHYGSAVTRGRPMKDPQQQRIKELEHALAKAELKIRAYEKLLELSAQEDGINLVKKSGAKPSTPFTGKSPK